MEKKGATPEPLITSTPLGDTLPPPFLHFLAPQPSVPEMGAEQAHRGAVGIPSPYASLPLMAKGIYAGTRRGSLTPQFIHYRCPVPWGGDLGSITSPRGPMVSPAPGGHFPIIYPSAQGGVRGKGCQLILRWWWWLF